MKKSILIAVLATLPFSTPLAWAEEAHHSDQDKKPATTMTDKDKQMQMGKMQESMLRMHEQMHKIMQSKDAKERERLMQEHSKMMQDNMHTMQGMMGGKMDGGMKGM
jgi:oligoendopeptidase F